jgi:transposase
MERLLNRQRKLLREAARNVSPFYATNLILKAEGLPELQPPRVLSQPSLEEQRLRQSRRADRFARYEEVKRMQRRGASINSISRKLGMHRETVRMFIQADEYPERVRPRPKPSKVKPFAEYLKKRWCQGCHNARKLYREIRGMGYTGHQEILRRYLQPWRRLLPEEIRHLQELPDYPPPAPCTAVWWLLKDDVKLKVEEQDFVIALLQLSPEIKRARALAREFREMVRERGVKSFDRWMKAVNRSQVPELIRFAAGLLKDESAVRGALSSEWSNGQVEGQVNRLKLLKRQMYGRAKFDLLRARVLYAA